MLFAAIALTLLSLNEGGVDFKIEGETRQIDPGKSLFLDLTLKTPKELAASLPDLRNRLRGFSLADSDEEEPSQSKLDGSITRIAHWRLVPEPCAKEYKIAPFAVAGHVAKALYFEPPAHEDAPAGAMELDPRKDMPPFSWRLAGRVALALGGVLALAFALWAAVRQLARRVREHRMSPVERAWAELSRLLGKGLPGRGRYKDFYVELTQLVRRYIQRQHGLKAPHLTTEEFFAAARASASFPKEALDELAAFMQSADMVKFAGVQATPEMADEATSSARGYIAKDDEAVRRGIPRQDAKKGGEA